MKSEIKTNATIKAVRLKLPSHLYQRVEQAAQAAKCNVNEMIVATLTTQMPPLSKDLPPALATELSKWTMLDDEALRAIANAFLPPKEQRRFTTLLRKSQAGKLSAKEQIEWKTLQQEYLRISQNKAKAQYLLTLREKIKSNNKDSE
jgi:hypothetical protein